MSPCGPRPPPSRAMPGRRHWHDTSRSRENTRTRPEPGEPASGQAVTTAQAHARQTDRPAHARGPRRRSRLSHTHLQQVDPDHVDKAQAQRHHPSHSRVRSGLVQPGLVDLQGQECMRVTPTPPTAHRAHFPSRGPQAEHPCAAQHDGRPHVYGNNSRQVQCSGRHNTEQVLTADTSTSERMARGRNMRTVESPPAHRTQPTGPGAGPAPAAWSRRRWRNCSHGVCRGTRIYMYTRMYVCMHV